MTTKIFDLLLLILVLSFSFCSPGSRKKQKAESTQPSVPVQTKQILPSPKNDLGELFDNTRSFEIVSFAKGLNTTFSYTDTAECRGWTVSKIGLYKIIQHSEPISGTTWDLAFGFHSCIIKGELLQDQQKFEFVINAGSWMQIKCRDTTLLLGDYNKADREYFLSIPEIH